MKLNVNIDHVATLREARGGANPDPLRAARAVEQAGAHGITFHLREDRRHIQDHDLTRLKKTVRLKLNMEMAATPEMVGIAGRVRPEWVTLVPEKRQELTTEGGLNLSAGRARLTRAVDRLRQSGIVVSLFIDPDPRQVRLVPELGASMIEIHTGAYADATSPAARKREWGRVKTAVQEARRLGLHVNAGHGLNYVNVRPIATLQGIEEVSIGHSIVARSIEVGMMKAVKEMLSLLEL